MGNKTPGAKWLVLAAALVASGVALAQESPISNPLQTACLVLPCTYTGVQTFTAAGGTFFGTSSAFGGAPVLRGPAGSNRLIKSQTATTNRWDFVLGSSGAESGKNAGSSAQLNPYLDSGVANGSLWAGVRGSGPQGNGNPYFSIMSVGDHQGRATTPSGVVGENYPLNDLQPLTRLGTNPITPDNGLTTATIAWTGHAMTNVATLYLTGQTAPCGQTMAADYYPVVSVTANTLTITTITDAQPSGITWSCGTAGGGSSVDVRPYITTNAWFETFTVHDSSPGFHPAMTRYYIASPDFLTTVQRSQEISYMNEFSFTLSPDDTSGTHLHRTYTAEHDVGNRGKNPGYNPDPATDTNEVDGLILVPLNPAGQFPGSGTDANTAFRCGRDSTWRREGDFYTKWYDCLYNRGSGLVSVTADPTGHGGVFLDGSGAWDALSVSPFATTNTSTTVTVTFATLAFHGTPTHVIFDRTQTVNGALITGRKSYAVSSLTATTFQITADSPATSTASGGVTNTYVSLDSDTPYSPFQISGEWAHGILCTPGYFDDGLCMKMNADTGVGWTDGTHTLTLKSAASVTGTLTLPSKTGTLVTGPTSTTANNAACFSDSVGTLSDCGNPVFETKSGSILGTIAANSTFRFPITGVLNSVAFSEAQSDSLIPSAGTFKNMYCTAAGAPGGVQTFTITLRVADATPTNGPVVTISGSNTTGSDLVDTAAVTAGQVVSYQVATSATATNPNRIYCGIQLTHP